MAYPHKGFKGSLNRLYARTVLILLIGALCACADPSALPNPAPDSSPTDPVPTPSPDSPEPEGRALEFDVCPQALAVPEHNRMFQGYDGWFFFDYDFGENDSLPARADFAVELSHALATQGVSLVVMPIPGRAVVRPSFLHRDDPQQTTFSAPQAEANYSAYVRALQQAGVGVVDIVAAAKAFDASGGQTFFKRDLHWTPEGANAAAQATAKVVRQVVKGPLPTTTFQVTRGPDKVQKGQFISNWLYGACGYTLPPEPLGTYRISHVQGADSAPEVVLAGSSFSNAPQDYGFLRVALQSEVLNQSVGAGGANLALEGYLASDEYVNHRPQVVVWEWAVYAVSPGPVLQRQLLAAVYGGCTGDTVRFERTQAVSGTNTVQLGAGALEASEHYLSLTFSNLSLLDFDLSLRYQGGKEETLDVTRSDRLAARHRGRFFTTLSAAEGALEEFQIAAPGGTGTVKVQVCRTPR